MRWCVAQQLAVLLCVLQPASCRCGCGGCGCCPGLPNAGVPLVLFLHQLLVRSRSEHLLQLLWLRVYACLPGVVVGEQLASGGVIVHHHTPTVAAAGFLARHLHKACTACGQRSLCCGRVLL